MAGDQARTGHIQFVDISASEAQLRSADLVGVVKAVLARRTQGGEDVGPRKRNAVGGTSE